MAGKYDIIFLAIRQRGNREAAQGLVSFLKEDGALVSVQNGLPERALSEVFGADRVYGCALSWGSGAHRPRGDTNDGRLLRLFPRRIRCGEEMLGDRRAPEEGGRRNGGGSSGAPLCQTCRQRRFFDALRHLRPHLRRTCFAAQKACFGAHARSILCRPRRGMQENFPYGDTIFSACFRGRGRGFCCPLP